MNQWFVCETFVWMITYTDLYVRIVITVNEGQYWHFLLKSTELTNWRNQLFVTATEKLLLIHYSNKMWFYSSALWLTLYIYTAEKCCHMYKESTVKVMKQRTEAMEIKEWIGTVKSRKKVCEYLNERAGGALNWEEMKSLEWWVCLKNKNKK